MGDDRLRLARGYRRLLACYPTWYRRVHEEEMLAVLMTAAPSGKRQPGIAEAADLIWGALRIRCQPSRADTAEPVWRDALAVLSVIVPLIVVVRFLANEARFLLLMPAPGPLANGFPLWVLNAAAAPLVLGALAPLGLRLPRLAALAGAGLLTWLIYDLPGGRFGIAVGDVPMVLAAATVTFALAVSGGPRRGLQILTWKYAALVTVATILVGTSVVPMDRPDRLVARLIVIIVIGAGMALTSSLGRWLVLLLTVAAYPVVLFTGLSLFPPGLRASLAFLPLMAAYYLPPVAVLLVAARRLGLRLWAGGKRGKIGA